MESKYVTTFGKRNAISSECKFIMGCYYLKNIECFYIDNQWYRINSPNLYKDLENNTFITKKQYNIDRNNNTKSNRKYTNGIIGGTLEKPIFGYFSVNKSKNIPLVDYSIGETYIFSKDVYNKMGYTMYNGIATDPKDFSTVMGDIDYHISNIKRHLPYRASEILYEFLEEYIRYNNDPEPKDEHPIVKEFLQYTFGIEIESDSGVIPANECYQLGLMGLRDGSIRGIEYATVPMSGQKGINSITEIFKAIRQHTVMTTNNSLHIHLGGFPKTKESISALYTLLYQIQDNLYTYFPSGYRQTSAFKHQDYCAPLPLLKAGRSTYDNKVESRFNSLYEWISDGESFDGFHFKEHPSDRSGHHKWSIKSR